MPTLPTDPLAEPLPRSWDGWFAAAAASGLSGEAWLTHWWDVLLPALRRARVRWQGPRDVPDHAWNVERWGATPERQHGLVNWERRPPHTWREALAWGLLDNDPKDAAWAQARSHAPVSHPMARPHRRARQWYAQGLRISGDDVTFWLDRMQESGFRSTEQPAYGGASDVAWRRQMGQVEGPLRAAVEIGRTSLDGLNADVERWWSRFEAPRRQGGLLNAPYLLTYLMRHGFAGAEHWRQRLLNGQSHWDALDSSLVLALATGTPVEVLARPWAPVAPDQAGPAWTFAHACVEHFQRKVEEHEVLLPADYWWSILRILNERQAPLFFAAHRPSDGAFLNPWEHARLRAEDPAGSNQQALNRERGVFSRALDPDVRRGVLANMARLHEQEQRLLLGAIDTPILAEQPRRARL